MSDGKVECGTSLLEHLWRNLLRKSTFFFSRNITKILLQSFFFRGGCWRETETPEWLLYNITLIVTRQVSGNEVTRPKFEREKENLLLQAFQMISQVNFARPWDMSGSAGNSVGGDSGNNNNNLVGNNNNNNSRLTALGLAPLQVSL